MSFIQEITLTQYRNYRHARYRFDAPVVSITGHNGCGKTNLLDAVYYLCYTKSYFTSSQQQLILHGADGFRIDGLFEKRGETERVSCRYAQAKKEIFLDQVPVEKATGYIGSYSAVMIAPDDIQLLTESSEVRRKWIDGMLCQTDRTYFELLVRYQKLLLQRNGWLKMQAVTPTPDYAQLDYYDQELDRCAAYLHSARDGFVHRFRPMLLDYYTRISGVAETVSIDYNSDLARATLAELLRKYIDHDMRLQRTTHGVHRDELEFRLNGMLIRQFSSQGQKKSFLFALKLAQYDFLYQQMGHKPVLLLDDVFEKLDQLRIDALLRIVHEDRFGQVLITDTHKDRIRAAFPQKQPVQFIELSHSE